MTAGSGKPTNRLKTVYRTAAEAKAAADGALGDLKRGKREGSLEMRGTPEFYAEALVSMRGFHPDVDGDYSAKSVTHNFSASGYTTNVTLEVVGETA